MEKTGHRVSASDGCFRGPITMDESIVSSLVPWGEQKKERGPWEGHFPLGYHRALPQGPRSQPGKGWRLVRDLRLPPALQPSYVGRLGYFLGEVRTRALGTTLQVIGSSPVAF